MSLPLDRATILERYQKKHDYYDTDLVLKAYGRNFERFMGIVWGGEWIFDKPEVNPVKEYNWNDPLCFAHSIDETIKEIEKEGLMSIIPKGE